MLKPSQIPGVQRKLKNGWTIKGVALEMGVSIPLLRQAIRQRQRQVKMVDLISERNLSIRELAKLGHSPNTIAEAFGMEPQTVRNIIANKRRPKRANVAISHGVGEIEGPRENGHGQRVAENPAG